MCDMMDYTTHSSTKHGNKKKIYHEEFVFPFSKEEHKDRCPEVGQETRYNLFKSANIL